MLKVNEKHRYSKRRGNGYHTQGYEKVSIGNIQTIVNTLSNRDFIIIRFLGTVKP